MLASEKVEWKNGRSHIYISLTDALNAIKFSFKDFPESYRFIAMNVMFVNFARSYDGWLGACDGMLQSGSAQYKTESSRNEVLSLARKYEELLSDYDNFCSSLNKKIGGENFLWCIYGRTNYFNWDKAGPENHHA